MKNIKGLIHNFFNKDMLLYIIFGILTTIVNIGSLYIMTNFWNYNENIANFIAILLAVLFAYITNRKLVFHTTAKGFKENLQEFLKFIAGRSVTMIIEWVGCAILFTTPIPTIISKCVISVVVIILNFIISKFFTFKQKKSTI